MNAEFDSQIEAYLFNELTLDERTALEEKIAQSPDLQEVVDAKREQALLLRRVHLRQIVREAQAETAATPNSSSGRVVSFPNFRWAAAAAAAVLLAGAAWFLWQQTTVLEKDVAQIEKEKRELLEKSARENDSKIAEKPIVLEKTELENSTNSTAAPSKNQPQKIADGGPKIIRPQESNGGTRGNESRPVQASKGQKIYQSVYQKPDLSRFQNTGFQGFIKFFNQKKYGDAIDRLTKMEFKNGSENGRHFLLGLAHLELNEPEKAIAQFDSLYEKTNPFFADTQFWLAMSFLRQGSLDAAQKLFSTISKTAGHPFKEAASAAILEF